MKLKLKHIAPYLPYGLMVSASNYDLNINGFIGDICSWECINSEFRIWNVDELHSELVSMGSIKPILRPLSSMSLEEIEELNSLIDDSVMVVVSSGNWVYIEGLNSDPWEGSPTLSLGSINKINEYLFSKHFDVFRLIDKGLAIGKTK